MTKNRGWYGNKYGHSLASRGIKSVINKQVKEYEMLPCEINSGECEDFAWKLVKNIPNAKVSESDWDVIFVNPNGKKEWIPTHFWVTVDGKHYDAECVDGVKDYHELPLFIRAGVPKDIEFIIDWGED